MKAVDRLNKNYIQRIDDVLDVSWRILKSCFIDGRCLLDIEAGFQHHFALIISTIGESFCSNRDDIFLVDLERKFPYKGRTNYIDITCEYYNRDASCAIELKFKPDNQGAVPNGIVDAYKDIEELEAACNQKYSIGRFYMITDNPAFLNNYGICPRFSMHDKAILGPNKIYTGNRGGKPVTVNLINHYVLDWEQIGDWYFLQVKIPPVSPIVTAIHPTVAINES